MSSPLSQNSLCSSDLDSNHLKSEHLSFQLSGIKAGRGSLSPLKCFLSCSLYITHVSPGVGREAGPNPPPSPSRRASSRFRPREPLGSRKSPNQFKGRRIFHLSLNASCALTGSSVTSRPKQTVVQRRPPHERLA